MSDPQARSRWAALLSRASRWLLLAAVAAGTAATCWYAWSLAHHGATGVRGIRIFYDQYHVVRHKIEGRNERGAWAYHEVSGYHEFARTLEQAGYDLHVHRRGEITPAMLDDFDVFVIGEQTHHATFMTPAEREAVFDFVRQGGGLWATIEHTDAHGMTNWWNPWMEGTGIQARKDSICEPNGTVDSRDWVTLTPVSGHPLTEGVEAIYTCNGCSLDTEHGIAFSSAESWSDAWNPQDPPVHNGDNLRNPGELSGPLAGLAAAEYGEGRIAVTCDHNIFSNPTLYVGDHHRFLLNAMAWLAGGERTNPDLYSLPVAGLSTLVLLVLAARRERWPLAVAPVVLGLAGGLYAGWRTFEEPQRRDILVTDTHDPDMRVRSKDPGDLFTFFEHLMKDDDTYAWLGRELEPGYDALVLNSPTQSLSDADLAVVDGYLVRGRTVVWLASRGSLGSPAGAQLQERYGIRIQTSPRPDRDATRLYRVDGDPALTRRTELVRMPPTIRDVTLEGDDLEVLVELARMDQSMDFIGYRPARGGRFAVVAEADLLGNRNIRKKKVRMTAVDLSMNLADWAVGR